MLIWFQSMFMEFVVIQNVRKCLIGWQGKMPILFYFKKYSIKEVERYWKQQWTGKMVFSHGTNHSKGVTILFNEKLDFEIKHSIGDQNGRFIILDIGIQGHPVILANVYFHCASKPTKQELMWDNLRKFISEIGNYDDKSLLLGYDFNVLMNIHLHRTVGILDMTKGLFRKLSVLWMTIIS